MKKYIALCAITLSLSAAESIHDRVVKDTMQAARVIENYQGLGLRVQNILTQFMKCTEEDYTKCVSISDIMALVAELRSACKDERELLGPDAYCASCRALEELVAGLNEYLSDRFKTEDDPAASDLF